MSAKKSADNSHQNSVLELLPENLIGQYQNFTQADITKLRKAGIEHKFTSLEDAVNDYVKNYLMKGYIRI